MITSRNNYLCYFVLHVLHVATSRHIIVFMLITVGSMPLLCSPSIINIYAIAVNLRMTVDFKHSDNALYGKFSRSQRSKLPVRGVVFL